jgi:putative transposase
MPRRPRVQYSGAIHHVTSRGASRATLFRTDRDYSVFLATLAGAIGSTRWQCLAYCLMPNHYHLLLETPQPNLSEGMHHLNGTYARRFNAEHDHAGHVFDSRFHTALVTRESHLFQTARYIVLNPVRAAIANRPEDWRWSSYRATSAITRSPSWLRSARLLALFGADVQSARYDYREFVRDGIDPWNRGTPPLGDVLTCGSPEQIITASRTYGYTQAAIASHLGVSQATVSRIVRRAGVE